MLFIRASCCIRHEAIFIVKTGFTLVELLIVIALLGVIATIVIAAINPIEQANRARDTRFKADGGQILSAIERYFTAKAEFPWVTEAVTADSDTAFGFISASSPGVGICLNSACADGAIMTALELKSEFKNRDFITKGNASDLTAKLFVGKAMLLIGVVIELESYKLTMNGGKDTVA